MNIQKIAVTIGVIVLLTGAAIGAFVYWFLPQIKSPAVAGLAGVMVGALVGVFGSILTAIVGAWKASIEAEERLKDRISNHALQLTQIDYDLRQKSLDPTDKKQLFLAPAKVYRTFYRALLELHTSGNWPKEVEELGLLNIFALGSTKGPKSVD